MAGLMDRLARMVKGGKATAPAFKQGLEMKDLGIDRDSTLNRLTQTRIQGAERPSNMWFRTNGQTAYWYQYALMDWYVSEVSVLSTIILRSTTELLRYGLELTPRFAKKCTQCGYEAQTLVDCCPQCGSRKMRRPDENQKKYFRRPDGTSFLDCANDNNQSLKDVLKMYAESQYQNNQAYTLCVTGDVIDPETGRRVRGVPLEFINVDPKFVRFLYDDTGKPGYRYAFTMEARDCLLTRGDEPDDIDPQAFEDAEGRELYPAAWQVGSNYGGTGKYLLYTMDEVYQDKWFRPSMTYGMPIWFDIEDDLLAYHYIEKHNLKKYKFGYVRKLVILPGFNDEDVEDITKGIQDVLATNDNSIPIVCTPPLMQGVAEQRAQTLELGAEDASVLLHDKDDIRNRLCAHGGVPDLFAGDTEASGGMNNESQQITAFDRFLMDKYDYLDRQLKWILSWFPLITDYDLCVTRPSKAATGQRRRMDLIQEMAAMAQIGFIPRWIDGEPRYPEVSIQEIQFRQQMEQAAQEQQAMQQQAMMQQQQAMAGAMTPQNGSPGSAEGGEDLQDQGSARREDGEIADSKQAVDDSAREAMGAFMASARRKGGSRGYRKDLTDQGWKYYLAKDAYSFLADSDRAVRDMVRDLGGEMAPVFRTCSEDQVRSIYSAIVREMGRDHWETSRIRDAVMDIAGDNDGFTEKDADRIVGTELERILCYAKERFLEGTDERVFWAGPMDDRTTGMCAYAQTGKLGREYSHLRGKLPAWKKSFSVDELKEFLRKVHDVFHEAGYVNTQMVSDWIMHINCRHTFQTIPGGHTPRSRAWHEVPVQTEDAVRHDVPGIAFEAGGKAYVSRRLGEDPVMFRFPGIDADGLRDWAKTVSLMQDGGEDEKAVKSMLAEDSPFDTEEALYLLENAGRILEVLG